VKSSSRYSTNQLSGLRVAVNQKPWKFLGARCLGVS
jgi:hypothetical protein